MKRFVTLLFCAIGILYGWPGIAGALDSLKGPAEKLIDQQIQQPPPYLASAEGSKYSSYLIIDGSPDDWKSIACTEILDSESNLVKLDGINNPQAAKWIDFKKICYLVQGKSLFLLIEFYGEIHQNDPETRIIGYGISFRDKPKLKTTPVLGLDYIPGVGTDLYLWNNNRRKTLDLQGVKAAYSKNYVELELPISSIKEYVSTPYINYISYRNINEGPNNLSWRNMLEECQNAGTIVCSYRIGDWDLNKYVFIQLNHTANSTPKTLPHAAFATATFYGPTSYLSFRDSPFSGTKFGYFHLEDFEDGLLNTPGVTASSGWSVISGNNEVDSVDADDGVIDGKGNTGKSFFSNFVSNRLTFTFNAATPGGNLPTHAGIVWTDVKPSASRRQVEFSALDRSGTSLGSNGPFELGDDVINGTTAEDRFFGVYNPSGISSITISMPGSNNWEVDHLQYGSVIEKQAPVKYPDLEPTQPSLHLTASALRKSANEGGALFIDSPINIGIGVSFKGYVTQVSNSAFYTGYRYLWFIDGVKVSEEAKLTQSLLPRDNPYNVVLKVEKLDDTAQSTPPVYSPNPVKPTLDASIQVSIKPHPEWDCKGRLGSGCSDSDIINKTATTRYTVVPCDHPENEQICIKSQMSVGSIRHDRCCESTPSLHFCSGPIAQFSKKDVVASLYKEACEKEWEQAFDDSFDRKRAMFDYIWKYQPAGNRPSEGRPGWWIGLAPAGVVVSREESEPGPTEKAICKSREVEPVKTLVQLPVNATYIRGNTIEKTTSWVCSANKSDQKINKPPLVNPQGKIDTVGKKITPAVKSKAKKDTLVGCNKGSSVLSPSIGGKQGALKKYGTGTDGCAQ